MHFDFLEEMLRKSRQMYLSKGPTGAYNWTVFAKDTSISTSTVLSCLTALKMVWTELLHSSATI